MVLMADEYKQVTGGAVPYRKLGFARLDDFLQSAPNTIHCTRAAGPAGGLLVRAVPKSGSAHIQELVARQKKAKTKPKYSVCTGFLMVHFKLCVCSVQFGRIEQCSGRGSKFSNLQWYSRLPEALSIQAASLW